MVSRFEWCLRPGSTANRLRGRDLRAGPTPVGEWRAGPEWAELGAGPHSTLHTGLSPSHRGRCSWESSSYPQVTHQSWAVPGSERDVGQGGQGLLQLRANSGVGLSWEPSVGSTPSCWGGGASALRGHLGAQHSLLTNATLGEGEGDSRWKRS